MYYKTSVFSLLVGATKSLQVSPDFGEFFININKAHSGHPS